MDLFEHPAKFDDWDKIPNLTPIEAAYLWLELEPQQWFENFGPQRVKALAIEIATATNTRLPDSKRLFSIGTDSPSVKDDKRERASRQELISFAEGKGEKPAFLFPSERMKRPESANPMPTLNNSFLAYGMHSEQEAARDLTRLRQQIDTLTSERDEWKRKAEASRNKNPESGEHLHPRTKNNYLRLIMALAMDVKDFDPKKPYESAKLIIEHTGIELDNKTIAGYITEAYSLQSKEKE